MKWFTPTPARIKSLILVPFALVWGSSPGLNAQASPPATPVQTPADPATPLPLQRMYGRITQAQRQAAADRAAAARKAAAPRGHQAKQSKALAVTALAAPVMNPLGTPDYLGGVVPNYANSPILQKFVHTLPGLTAANANDLGQFIPLAIADKTTFPGSDYYQIGLTDYTQQLHKDLPAPTKLRGYMDLAPGADGKAHYLGPLILAQRDRPVRIKFTNMLGTGTAGNLFIPVDTTAMGAGTGPLGGTEKYTQNRAELHLHGGATPWISDGTPHQWITPAGETTSYKKGVSQQNVPDMPDPGDGSATYFYTNQQSSRMMFYHDHAYGITRLNVYAGEAAGYLLTDPVEDHLIDTNVIPGAGAGVYRYGIPLVIQDKTFVPDLATLAAEDPTWDPIGWAGPGNLWYPHVYMPNQNPNDISGANPMGRWDYGPWFWPPVTTLNHMPFVDPVTGVTTPNMPNPSLTPEAFMDTPLVNGTPYPKLNVLPQPYRFRILSAGNDRTWNLSFFQADPANPTEVKMVPAAVPPAPAVWPATWPSDGRAGGVPDPTLLGPSFVQIGTEGGMLANPVVIPPQPIDYVYDRRNIVVLNVGNHGLLLGPAERADVIVDFSAYAGKTLILYNDSPAPVPAFDPRYDYYTGDPDQRPTGGAAPTLPGFGPNTRTIMQIVVGAGTPVPFNMAPLTAAFTGTATTPSVFGASQPTPLVPQVAYGNALGTTLTDTWSRIQSTSLTFTPIGGTAPTTVPMEPKAIQELFELDWGRMNATLGVELPFTNFNTQTTIPLGYVDPLTENLTDGAQQIWKITHNGVDTHFIHFHLFNVQLINRVGWDGQVRMPDPNEIGWKDTVRMNPLEDAIVAFKPMAQILPFDVPPSIRPLDPTAPLGPITVTNPADGNAITVNNDLFNFGWEYVWHCHILGHEENDMMRPMSLQVPSITVSGHVTAGTLPLAGVTITPSGGMTPVLTDASGFYSFSHSSHWTGTVTPAKAGVVFTPTNRSYTNVVTDQVNQDFTSPAPVLTITGHVSNGAAALAGVSIAVNGVGKATTNASGNYTVSVTAPFTGNVNAVLAGFRFTPAPAVLTGVTTSQVVNFTSVQLVTGITQLNTNGTLSSLAGALITLSNGTTATTSAAGAYQLLVPTGFTGSITPSFAGLVFTPASIALTNLATGLTNQNFVGASSASIKVSGQVTNAGVPLAGVSIAFNGVGKATTDVNGNYSVTVVGPYTANVSAVRAGFRFTPSPFVLNAVTTNQTVNFQTAQLVTGRVQLSVNGVLSSLPGVLVTLSNGTTATTNATGNYQLLAPTGFSGTLTPSITGRTFTPASRTITNITATLTSQNFTAQ